MSVSRTYKKLAFFSFIICASVFYFSFGVYFFDVFKLGKVQAASITWDGEGGDDDWCTDANWSGNEEPTSADDVTIDLETVTTTSSGCVTEGKNLNFNSLTLGGSNTTTLTLSANIGTGGSITIRSLGTLTQNTSTSQTITGTLTIQNGGAFRHADNSTAQSNFIDFSVGGFDLQSGGTVNIDHLGYDGGPYDNPGTDGKGPGAGSGGSNVMSGGGAHAGNGGNGINSGVSSGTGGTGYGNFATPNFLGSGGGSGTYAAGGAGGGAMKITITGGGTATVEGSISAKGGNGADGNGNSGGGGAGGAVWFNFTSNGTFAGAGSVDVSGGSGVVDGPSGDFGGGGGGGRIAVTGYSSYTFSGTHTYNSGNTDGCCNAGPKDGGGGTLWLKDTTLVGDLYIGRVIDRVDLTRTSITSSASIGNLTILTGAYLFIDPAVTLTLSSSSTIGTSTGTAYLDVDGIFSVTSSFSIPTQLELQISPTDFSGVTDLTIDTNGTLNLEENATSTSALSLETLTVNGTLTHKSNSSTVLHAINISANTITVGATGFVSTTGKGFSGGATLSNGNGPGAGTYASDYGGGGGYGGVGGTGNGSGSTGGSAYGATSTAAHQAGSGGAGSTYSTGGGGGGIIHLVAAETLTLSGIISANGAAGSSHCGAIPSGASGGGSGGGIHLEAETLAGVGALRALGGAAGGNGVTCNGGPGAGGRILVTVNTNDFTGTTSIEPGARNGSGGTAATSGTVKFSPSKPTTLFSHSTDASSGSVNPTGLTSTAPLFSALYNGVQNATKARIQVSTDAAFSSVTHWESGSGGSSISSCANAARCNNITYGSFGSSPTQNLSLNDDATESSNTIYYWRLQYFDTDNVSSPFSSTSTFSLLDNPNEVSALATSSVAATSLILSWTDNSSIEDNVLVSYAADAVSFANTSTLAANTTNTTITGLIPNTDYTFSVQATNTAGVSNRVTTTLYTLANIPTALINTAKTKNSVTMEWTANSNPTSTEYCIVQANTSCGASDWQTAQTKTFSDLSSGTDYSFTVKARNALNEETNFTSSVSVTTNPGGDDNGGGGGGGPEPEPDPIPDLPEPLPISDDEPQPESPLSPTGLIQIVSSEEVNVMKDAGLSSNYSVSTYADVKSIKDGEAALDLNKPFRFEINFTPNAAPIWRVGQNNRILTKEGAYWAGYGKEAVDITGNGFCFQLTNIFLRVCDKQVPTPFTAQHYVVRWDGSELSLLNGDETKKYDSIPLTSIASNNSDLVIGGTRTEYKPGKFGTTFFPLTLHTLKIDQESPLVYTNKKKVLLKIDATYANLLWLDESDGAPEQNFKDAVVEDVKPEKIWMLQGQDGKKCINAKFLNQPKPGQKGATYEYITYACVYLDREKPDSEFDVEVIPVNNKISLLKIFGSTDPHATVTIFRKKKDASSSFAPRLKSEQDLPSVRAANNELGKIYFGYVTEEVKKIYTTIAQQNGDWEYLFEEPFKEGNYTISAKSTDLAGNTSDEVAQNVQIEKTEPPVEEPVVDELPVDEIPVEEPVVDELPVDETPIDEPLTEEPVVDELPVDEPTGIPTDIDNTVADTSDNKSIDGSAPLDTKENINGKTYPDKDETTSPFIGKIPKIANTVFENVREFVSSAVSALIKSINEIINNPVVEAVNEKVAAPALFVAGVANVAVGVQLPNILSFLRYLFSQPAMLFRRRKRKTWGIVYNGFTKQPLDLTTLRVIDDETKKIIRTQVTDGLGRYFLFVPKGNYRIEIIKPGFTGFSQDLKTKDEDAKYTHLYHGERFEVAEEQQVITYNIPVDPDIADKPTHRIVRDHSVQVLRHAFSSIGLWASIVSFVISPSVAIGALVVLHIFFYAIFHRFAHRKLGDQWGTVRAFKDKTGLSKVVVRVFDSAYNKLINMAVTDGRGRYAVLVGPSVYHVTYEKEGFEKKKSPNLDFSEGKTKGVGGIIIRDEDLRSEAGTEKTKKDEDNLNV